MKFYLIVITFLLFVGLPSCTERKIKGDVPATKTSAVKVTKPDTLLLANPDAINITAVGDIMLGTSYPDNKTLPPDSAKYAFTLVEDHLKNADLTFGNLEGTLLDTGKPVNYKLHFRSKGYLFRSPVKYVATLKNAGFDVLSVANNHIDDFGLPGRLSTVKALDSAAIYNAGLLARPSAVFTLRGIKYGFCAFSPNGQTAHLNNLKRAGKIIKALKDSCDIVIVSFHGGGEGAAFEHVSCENEVFVGENRGNVNAFAHNAIDNGADLVLGHGPHVSRAMELYHSRLIAYSLGNFCTYKGVSIDGVCGIAPLLKIVVNKKGEFIKGRIISVKQSHRTGLQVDTMHRAAKRVKWLTETDFPQSGLKISETGIIEAADAPQAKL